MQQITDNIFIGDQKDALLNSSLSDVDMIIYLGQEIPTKLCFDCSPTCIHMPLIDGLNKQSRLKHIINITYQISRTHKVLITCRAGLSRSVLITAAVVALSKNMRFDEAYKYISRKIPQALPEQTLMMQIKRILEEMK